jgi:inosose dehydratase
MIMQLGYHTITWGGVTGDPVGVTSVKDLWYRAGGSMERALRDIAVTGYSGVEMFDGNVADYADAPGSLRALLDEAGLTLVTVYSGANFIYEDSLADEMWRVGRAARLAAELGASGLVVGGGARRASGTLDSDYDLLARALDRVSEIASGHGLIPTYHPHLTTMVESPEELEKVMDRSGIGLCVDTAHLAAGGGDPAALIRSYAGRVRHVHLKDLRRDPLTFLPLGEGELDFPGVLAALADTRYAGWLVVELDSYDGSPRKAARISKEFLDRVLAGQSLSPVSAQAAGQAEGTAHA